MSQIIEICKKEQCTGCCACNNVCPTKAISMKLNKEGFYSPEVDAKKCIGCKKCINVCPSNKELSNITNTVTAYAIKTKDKDAIKRSASGGFFYGLARYVIENGGVVYGTNHMTMDNGFKPSVICVDKIDELYKIQGSKYVQSYVGDIYIDVKKNLDNNKLVLFSGVPCQVNGLYSFLGENKEKLITAEIVCHGVPSLNIFSDYIKDMENRKKKKIKDIRHRVKNKKVGPLLRINTQIEFSDGQLITADYKKDDFLYAFNKNIIFNDACYNCKYAKLPRNTDFTIGDFLGIGAATKSSISISNGISQVLLNTEKGRTIFDSIKCNFDYELHDLEECMIFNKNIYKPTFKPPVRDILFQDYEKFGYDYVKNKYIKRRLKEKTVLTIREVMRTIMGERIVVKLMYYKKKIFKELP